MRAVQLERVDAEPLGALRAVDEGVADALKARRVERERRGLALLVRQRRRRHRLPAARWPSGISWPPSQGRALEALRPACASCIATAAFECLRTQARIGFSAASLASL